MRLKELHLVNFKNHRGADLVLGNQVNCFLGDNEAQTEARSGGVHGNKGVEAAVGLLHMLALKRTLTSS